MAITINALEPIDVKPGPSVIHSLHFKVESRKLDFEYIYKIEKNEATSQAKCKCRFKLIQADPKELLGDSSYLRVRKYEIIEKMKVSVCANNFCNTRGDE